MSGSTIFVEEGEIVTSDDVVVVTDGTKQILPLPPVPPHAHGEEAWPELSPLRSVVLMLNLALTMTLSIVCAQAVVVCLPSIGKELNIQGNNLQFVISAYTLAFGCLLLLFGRLSDLFGHKYLYLTGLAWFSIWSIACGLANGPIAIFIFRAFQGVGAAASIPSAMGVIAHTWPPGPRRSTAFASFSAGAALGGSLGNLFGGVLTTYTAIGYRAVFHVCAGIGAFVFLLATVVVPQDYKKRTDDNKDRSVDWIGAFLVTAGLVLLTFALADGQTAPQGWRTGYILATFILSLFLLVGFGFWEYHIENRLGKMPLMRLGLWKRPYFAIVQIVTMVGWSCFTSQQYFSTLYYQDYLHLTPIQTTVRYLPMSITGLILNFTVALIAAKCSAQVIFLVGLVGTSMSPLLFILRTDGASYWRYEFPAMILTVFGADLVFACGIMAGAKVARRDEQALAGGIFNTVTQIGAAVGLAIVTQIEAKVTTTETSKLGLSHSDSVPSSVLLKGLHSAFWGTFAFGVAATIIAAAGLWRIGTVGEKGSEAAVVASSATVAPTLPLTEEKEVEATSPMVKTLSSV